MRKLLFSVVLTASISGSFAQGFWAPGACWIYYEPMTMSAERHHHLSDTMVDGMLAQKTRRELGYLDPGGTFYCPGVPAMWYEYTMLAGEVMLLGGPPFASWDTLYRLGLPGERWWPIGSEDFCNGYEGMIQISDTGHVVVQGVTLRTWDLTTLYQDGSPQPAVFETITERLGAVRRRFNPSMCSVPVDFT